jgi:hypothetical protein
LIAFYSISVIFNRNNLKIYSVNFLSEKEEKNTMIVIHVFKSCKGKAFPLQAYGAQRVLGG